MRFERVIRERDVAVFDRFAGEKDQHIAGRMPAFVLKLPGALSYSEFACCGALVWPNSLQQEVP